MRIAWDLQAVTGPRPTGLGQSVRLLLDASAKHLPDIGFVGLPPNDQDAPLIGVPDRLRWEQLRLPARLRGLQRHYARHGEAPLDLLYSPALGAPLRSPVPVLAHVHDLIPLRFPEQFSSWAGLYWKRLLPAGWRRCRALTVSNSWLVREVSTHLPYPAEQIHVVPYYADPRLQEIADSRFVGWREAALAGRRGPADKIAEGQDPEPVFLCLGSHEKRKNFAVPIEALSLLAKRGIRARLRIIGGETEHTKELQDFARRAGVSERVELIGYAEREALVSAMLSATALLFLSRYEGFGMPPQEAQSLGLPVILSDIPCHKAVYDDVQRWDELAATERVRPPLINPGAADDCALLMQRLVEDKGWRAELSRSGLAYQRTFSSERTAAALRQAFEAALAATSGE